jgi:flagellar biosynthesis protein FlhA
MNSQLQILQQWLGRHAAWASGLAAPVLVITILSMMVLPLSPWVLDTFFTLNIAVALVVMMVAAYMRRPLDFSVFPTVLLLTTLLRLSLNVGSTRVVLLEGHTGPGAAGAVIEAFGHFLIGGNFAVGLIVFAILVVINFVVITKGSERIAEVSARFTLDAMPGKQMAIDADMNAGLIDEKEAKRRRAEVGEEAEFFGSMDGASKFVRGDAIAGILILFINIIGGFAIGVLQHGLSVGEAADSYILLAVGDALVAQIPGLLISVAAAMVVSRVGKDEDLGVQVMEQMFLSSKVMGITAGVMFLLGIVPGMPHTVFLTFAAIFGGIAWWRHKEESRPVPVEAAAPAAADGDLDDLQPVDRSAEMGAPLMPWWTKPLGDLLTAASGRAQEIRPRVGRRQRTCAQPGFPRASLRGGGGRGEVFPACSGHRPRRHGAAHQLHDPWLRALDRRQAKGERANGGFYRG